jgi:hypothetical protein
VTQFPVLAVRGRRFGVALCLALVCASVSAQGAPAIGIDLEPLLGSGTPAVDGWMSAHVRIENRSSEVVRGTLSVEAQVAWARGGGGPHNGTDVPFSVAARSQVALEVPVHGFPGMAPSLSVAARGADGQLLAEAKSAENRTHDPLIFDFSSPSHVAPAVRLLAIPLSNTRWGGLSSPLVSVSSARQDARTGEPIVPRHASGYAAATVVLATSAELALIGEEARAALSDWLLAGGALAVVPERPEDLRAPYLESWVGGSVYEQPPADELRGQAVFSLPIDPSGGPSGSRPSGIAELRLTPTAESRQRLRGYGGGNLRPTPWGAAASYGLGELHLLAFRPNSEPFASDPWTHHKLADLTRHAWDRDATIALPFAEQTLDESRLSQIRRELDPNQGTRWTIVVSALLLLAYAGLAGPLNFYLARKSGKPLSALLRLPALSAFALSLVVALGAVGRGVSGRARRLTLVEAGAGMTRATATRFRGLYASSARERTVQASARGNVLDVAGDAEQTGRRLVVDRDGARLTNLRGRPWEVVVVQEDGFIGLGGGVSLLQGADGKITIKNRIGRDLVGVVLMSHGSSRAPAHFFIRIKDGEAVSEDVGQAFSVPSTGPLGRSGLNLDAAKDRLESCSKGLFGGWEAIEGATTRNIDFWPDDVPVLLGQLDGGEGKLTDSGFPLEADRTLIRVVGVGGVP